MSIANLAFIYLRCSTVAPGHMLLLKLTPFIVSLIGLAQMSDATLTYKSSHHCPVQIPEPLIGIANQ